MSEETELPNCRKKIPEIWSMWISTPDARLSGLRHERHCRAPCRMCATGSNRCTAASSSRCKTSATVPTPPTKSARIVGEVWANTILTAIRLSRRDGAHGARLDALPLVDAGQFRFHRRRFPFVMRYTEARLAKTAEELLTDLEKETVDFTDNFDGSLQEPEVLPARMPNLLMNGSSGIAVGMATNIPPHNLRELTAALNILIDRYDEIDEVSVEDLMQAVPGPDFPTGGIIVGGEGIRQAYSTGRGKLTVRGAAEIEEIKAGRYAIIITEIPYQLNKTSLIERIAELVRSGKLDTISDMRDESDRRGLRIVIELKRGTQPKKVLNQLYKFTPLQSTFGVQLLALVDGEPRTLSLKRALFHYLEHRQVVITRRALYELTKPKTGAHPDGLIALANLTKSFTSSELHQTRTPRRPN